MMGRCLVCTRMAVAMWLMAVVAAVIFWATLWNVFVFVPALAMTCTIIASRAAYIIWNSCGLLNPSGPVMRDRVRDKQE